MGRQLVHRDVTHGSWDHILGNMLILAIFGKNVEDAYGHLRYLGLRRRRLRRDDDANCGHPALRHGRGRVPNLGAGGAIAAVLGAFFILYPTARIGTLVLVFFVKTEAVNPVTAQKGLSANGGPLISDDCVARTYTRSSTVDRGPRLSSTALEQRGPGDEGVAHGRWQLTMKELAVKARDHIYGLGNGD